MNKKQIVWVPASSFFPIGKGKRVSLAAKDTKGTVKNKPELAKPGEDLFVGTYNQSRYGNKKTGLNETHTPHHVVQDAVSQTTHAKGIRLTFEKIFTNRQQPLALNEI